MCVTPNFVYIERAGVYVRQPKSCGSCWRCISNRRNDFIGRSLCEADTSDWTCALTLTYRTPDEYAEFPLAHKVITPPHFQRFIRAMRRRGHKIRYLVAGEYGERKGRAHFHCILFGKGPKPHYIDRDNELAPWPQKENFHIPHLWPHGHVFCDWDNDEKSFRYVCKYLTKELGDNEQAWFSMSKKPALGHEWMMRKAANHAQQGVMPRSFEYRPPNSKKSTPFMMRGAIKRDFLKEIKRLWPHEDIPIFPEGQPLEYRVKGCSEWINQAYDKLYRDERQRRVDEAFTAMSIDDATELMADAMDAGRPSERSVMWQMCKLYEDGNLKGEKTWQDVEHEEVGAETLRELTRIIEEVRHAAHLNKDASDVRSCVPTPMLYRLPPETDPRSNERIAPERKRRHRREPAPCPF